MLQITEKIRESIDKGKFGCGIFIDLRKAFDTANHQILLHKLDHYGIRGSALSWFESYLNKRKQYVYLNGESSDLKKNILGVPQGSVLGPSLFLLYRVLRVTNLNGLPHSLLSYGHLIPGERACTGRTCLIKKFFQGPSKGRYIPWAVPEDSGYWLNGVLRGWSANG